MGVLDWSGGCWRGKSSFGGKCGTFHCNQLGFCGVAMFCREGWQRGSSHITLGFVVIIVTIMTRLLLLKVLTPACLLLQSQAFRQKQVLSWCPGGILTARRMITWPQWPPTSAVHSSATKHCLLMLTLFSSRPTTLKWRALSNQGPGPSHNRSRSTAPAG